MPGSTRRRLPWLMAHTVNRVTTRVAQSSHGPFSLVQSRKDIVDRSLCRKAASTSFPW